MHPASLTLAAGACALSCAVATSLDHWQDGAAKPRSPSRGEVERTVSRLVSAGKPADALPVLEAFIAAHPGDSQSLFDAARVSSLMGDPRQSASFAIAALRAGWLDDAALATHADLARARAHEAWRQVEDVRREVRARGPSADPPPRGATPPSRETLSGDARARESLSNWLDRFGGGRYRIETNPGLNLLIASSIDRESLDRTITALGSLSGALTQTLFGGIQDEAVLLVISTTADAELFFKNPEHAGLYEHGPRRLVTRDTGASLRHEYTHVLHHGHMARKGQHHPLWIQEGIATLFEHWQRGPAQEVVILPNLRTNEAYELVRRHREVPLAEFVAMDDALFLATPIDRYAQARSLLLYVAQQGKLADFYRALVSGFESDPTGRRALEASLEAPLGRIEAQWKAWVRERGPIDAAVTEGDGVMGVSVSGLPDGVRIDSVQDGAPAQRAGLRVGDVITQMDGTDVRGVGDFLLVSAKKNAGENLTLRFRRADSYATVQVRLASGHASPP